MVKRGSQEAERTWLGLTVGTEITKNNEGHIIRRNASESGIKSSNNEGRPMMPISTKYHNITSPRLGMKLRMFLNQ